MPPKSALQVTDAAIEALIELIRHNECIYNSTGYTYVSLCAHIAGPCTHRQQVYRIHDGHMEIAELGFRTHGEHKSLKVL